MGSDGSAASGGSSDQSEWQRSADDAAAPSARKMPGTATGRQAGTYKKVLLNYTCRCDGIGRRSGLKIHRWRQRTGSSPVTGTNKKGTFVYQKFLFCLSKPQAWHIITARSAVHIISPYGAVSHHASACISLRLDDIQHNVLMICNSYGIDDIQGVALIVL